MSSQKRLPPRRLTPDRKSTRLNSSHSQISYAVFCLKKKKKEDENTLYSRAPDLPLVFNHPVGVHSTSDYRSRQFLRDAEFDALIICSLLSSCVNTASHYLSTSVAHGNSQLLSLLDTFNTYKSYDSSRTHLITYTLHIFHFYTVYKYIYTSFFYFFFF